MDKSNRTRINGSPEASRELSILSSIAPSRAAALLAAACCVSALPAPGYAADEAQPDTMEAITVTGIRASIQSAIQIKRESSDIVEAISSEDIGKLPDPSIAESLTRLPGTTAQRSDGRTSDISIRGFGPDFRLGAGAGDGSEHAQEKRIDERVVRGWILEKQQRDGIRSLAAQIGRILIDGIF